MGHNAKAHFTRCVLLTMATIMDFILNLRLGLLQNLELHQKIDFQLLWYLLISKYYLLCQNSTIIGLELGVTHDSVVPAQFMAYNVCLISMRKILEFHLLPLLVIYTSTKAALFQIVIISCIRSTIF